MLAVLVLLVVIQLVRAVLDLTDLEVVIPGY